MSNAVVFLDSGEGRCFTYGLPGKAYTARDNNLCFGNQGLIWADTLDLDAWAAESGADQESLVVDPMFESTDNSEDWYPTDGSPLVDNGHPMSAAQDLSAQDRDDNPDIGALERQ